MDAAFFDWQEDEKPYKVEVKINDDIFPTKVLCPHCGKMTFLTVSKQEREATFMTKCYHCGGMVEHKAGNGGYKAID